MKNRQHNILSAAALIVAVNGFSSLARADSNSVSADTYAKLFENNFQDSQPITTSTTIFSMDDAATTQSSSSGQTDAQEEADLAQKTLNPVADLISVPFQENLNFGIGPKNATQSLLNIQPVIPIHLTPDWNLISRTILPVIYAASPANGISSTGGLGDITQSFFFSPVKPTDGWIWGVGPVLFLPTATDPVLGPTKWGAGPTAVVLQQQHGWTYGMLVNQIWSFAGNNQQRSINATYMQPFVSYTFPTYTSISLNTESTYDWTGRQWTVPLNLTVSQILKIGKQPVSIQLGPRYYAEGPLGGPEWGMRLTFTFLFPN
jgi:hypothetical protein